MQLSIKILGQKILIIIIQFMCHWKTPNFLRFQKRSSQRHKKGALDRFGLSSAEKCHECVEPISQNLLDMLCTSHYVLFSFCSIEKNICRFVSAVSCFPTVVKCFVKISSQLFPSLASCAFVFQVWLVLYVHSCLPNMLKTTVNTFLFSTLERFVRFYPAAC